MPSIDTNFLDEREHSIRNMGDAKLLDRLSREWMQDHLSIDIGGDVVEVDVPLTTEFFWPSSQ